MMEERKFWIEHFSRTVSNDENIWRMKEERKKWNLYNEESRQHSIFNKRYLRRKMIYENTYMWNGERDFSCRDS